MKTNLSAFFLKLPCLKILFGLVLILIVLLPIFGHLNALPLRIWDESRNALNAIEMLNNKNYLVTHYQGNPDLWNTKPPLLIWFQVIWMKIIGVNELSVRLPSAIAAFLTLCATFYFTKYVFRNFWFAIITVLVLLTSSGFIGTHASRTGDYDSLLTLFTSLSCFSIFVYSQNKKTIFLYVFNVSLALAVLSKSVSALLFLPAIVVYLTLHRQVIDLLKNKHFYFSILLFILPVIAYYLLRESASPGYLDAVKTNELGGRFLNSIENHDESFWYYFDNLIKSRFRFWFLLIPCGAVIGLNSTNQLINRLTIFSLLMIFGYGLIISLALTKLAWYDVPLYPFLSILVSIFIFYVFEYLREINIKSFALSFNVGPLIWLFLVFVKPYQAIHYETYLPIEKKSEKQFYVMSSFLQNAPKSECLSFEIIVHNGYNAHLLFYIYLLENKGIIVKIKNNEQLEENETVAAYLEENIKFIKENFYYTVVSKKNNIQILQLHERKDR